LWQSLLINFLPNDSLHRAAVLVDATRGERAEPARIVRAVPRRRYQPSGERVTFADVAGIDDAKTELSEVVDFLRDPEKYASSARAYRRCTAFSGAARHRQTLLARAVAVRPTCRSSRCRHPNSSRPLSAWRVPRSDLFAQAKEAAPAIIFIDELDAIGRSRTSGVAGFKRATTSASRR